MAMPGVALRLESLHKRYKDVVAVKDLSLEIFEGEILGFLGPNGAGKTTSISMICGLVRPDRGRIFIDGQEIRRPDDRLRARIGICPQEIVLWGKLTPLEQLLFVGRMYDIPDKTLRESAGELLAVMGLEDKRNKLADTLSGGMKRRLNLAMALVHDPEILILDEPEAGLDPQSRVLVRDYIRQWASAPRRTVILTTHNMDEADRMAQRVAIIDHGELLVVDTTQGLKARIGEGGVLEIDLQSGDEDILEGALDALKAIAAEVLLLDGTLVLRGHGIASQVPDVMDTLETQGIASGEIRLRENTLEDVFIALTGRRLRE
jgi:ABC-2 type transport system ATP-binding protein